FTGGGGTITLSGVIEAAQINGSTGNDTLNAVGFSGTAILRGFEGNDTLFAGPGLELLDGGAGDDRLVLRQFGSLHTIVILGGAGADTLDFSTFNLPLTVNLSTTGAVQLAAVAELQLFLGAVDVENVIGGAGADTLTGNSLDNRFTGGGGADIIN